MVAENTAMAVLLEDDVELRPDFKVRPFFHRSKGGCLVTDW